MKKTRDQKRLYLKKDNHKFEVIDNKMHIVYMCG